MPGTSTLPPGPRWPMPVQTWAMLKDPVRFLAECQRRHGPVFRVRLLGYPNYVYVAEPDLAREVFATDRTVGRAGEVREPFIGPLVGKHSLLCLDGDEWLRQRKLIGPAFHRRQVESYGDEIAAIAAEKIAGWPRGVPVQLRPKFQEITLEVILRVVLGLGNGPRIQRLRHLLPDLIEAGSTPWLWAVPSRSWHRVDRSRLARRIPNPLRSFLRIRAEVDALLYAEIAERKHTTAESNDVMSLLMDSRDEHGRGMNDTELRDQLITLLVAGHETTATALAWAVERLARNPEVLAQLVAELDDGEETYLEAVVKEALRSRPVVLDTPRRVTEAVKIGGFSVPAGGYVAPALPLVHASPKGFPEAAEFRPDRYLGDSPVSGWIPFGGGKRHCVGSHFAMLELKEILRVCLEHFGIEASHPSPEAARMQHVTLVPEDLARVTLRPRSVPATRV